ncbi:MAG: transposase [Verrucomicrobiota bacterium]
MKSESDDLLEAQKDRLKIRENLLDNGIGECQLRDPIVRQEVLKVVQTMPTKVWTLVIMPNHLHCLISLNESRTLSSTLQTLKGISARRVNQKLKRSGSFWAKDYFDRIVRDRSHFFRCARYIRRNPQKAALGTTEFTLWESGYVSKLLTGAR